MYKKVLASAAIALFSFIAVVSLSGCGGDISVPQDPPSTPVITQDGANSPMVIEPDDTAKNSGMIIEPGSTAGADGDVFNPDSSKNYL